MTLTDATRDVVPDMLSCSGISNPMQWPPSSPPPRPEARVAIADFSDNVQIARSKSVFNVPSSSRSPGKVPLCLSRDRSWGQAASSQKTPPLTRQGKVRRESSSETTHTLSPSPLHTTLPVPSINTPKIDEISQICLFQFPALLTPACSSRATPGILFPLHN